MIKKIPFNISLSHIRKGTGMNTWKMLFGVCLALILVSGIAIAQSNGDYRSNPTGSAPYLWGTASNWETYSTDSLRWVPATNPPNSSANVTILAGDTISVSALGQCVNLTVEAGAVLQSNNVPVGSPQPLRVFGTSVTINGTLGKSGGDGLYLQFAGTSGSTITISGSGSIDIARVEMYRTNTTVVFNMNANLRFAGTDGNGGYGLQAADSATYTVNAGKTLTFARNSGVSLSGNADSVAVSAAFNIYGTLDLSQSGSNVILKTLAGDSAVFHVYNGGTVTVGGDFRATDANDGGKPATIIVDGTGALTIHGTADFSNPGMKVTGTGTFTLPAGATLNIGHAQGITASGATGLIQTSTRSFSSGANYVYDDTVAQATGNA